MADQKITELTENTTPLGTDLLALVDDPAGTPATQKIKLDTLANLFTNNSMARQAIINGNFDVWQRGVSLTPGETATLFIADRWKIQQGADGGTLPTVVHSRQLLTSGALYGSFYCYRVAPNGAGTSFGAGSYGWIEQRIENGVRNLCGDGKKVTVSFWAKSDIANKKIGIWALQNYGTGGSPSAAETLNGANWTLTSTWTKYTYTFTTNTLASKTFGTAFDDYLRIGIAYQWNTTYDERVGASTSEDYVGSGTIDIAQVQLCAGDVALPFMPKSFAQELQDCMRYYEKSYEYAVVPGTATYYGASMVRALNASSGQKYFTTKYKVNKRIAATPSYWDTAGNASKVTTRDIDAAETSNVTPTGLDVVSQTGFAAYIVASTVCGIEFQWAVSAEL